MPESEIGRGRIAACVAVGIPLGVLVLAFPALVNAYWLTVAILALFYAIVTSSWALLVGYAGQFSFGHMAFVSLGAYTSGLLVMSFGLPIPLGMAAGVVLCAVVGAGIGWLLRLSSRVCTSSVPSDTRYVSVIVCANGNCLMNSGIL